MKRSLFVVLPLLALLASGCDAGERETSSTSDGGTDTVQGSDAHMDGEALNNGDATPFEIAWVTIPAGSFEMGCSPADTSCSDAEKPVHTVTLPSFLITETEITQHQYVSEGFEDHSYFYECDNCPTDSITWGEAVAFCETLGGRLPTEAEWEYAARGGNSTIYGCGDDPSCLDDHAVTLENSGSMTSAVKSKQPNGYGVYDMLGNVLEWVEDCWHTDYSGDDLPADGAAWLGAECDEQTERVARGGCFGMSRDTLRVSSRMFDYPGSYTLPLPGFRCVRDLQ